MFEVPVGVLESANLFHHFFSSLFFIYSHKKTLQGLQALQPNNNTKLIIKRNNS